MWKGQLGNLKYGQNLKINPMTRGGAAGLRAEPRSSQMRHPSICALLSLHATGVPGWSRIHAGGSLFDLLHNSAANAPTLLSRISLEVASVNYLHEHTVIHRDIKSANVSLMTTCRMGERFWDLHQHWTEHRTSRDVPIWRPRSSRTSHMISSATSSRLGVRDGHPSPGKESGLQAAFAVAMGRRYSLSNLLLSSSPLSSSSAGLTNLPHGPPCSVSVVI